LAAVNIVNRIGVRASFLLLIYTLIVILVGPVLLVCWVFGRMRPIPDGRSPFITFFSRKGGGLCIVI
jgi:hypothetical protein